MGPLGLVALSYLFGLSTYSSQGVTTETSVQVGCFKEVELALATTKDCLSVFAHAIPIAPR